MWPTWYHEGGGSKRLEETPDLWGFINTLEMGAWKQTIEKGPGTFYLWILHTMMAGQELLLKTSVFQIIRSLKYGQNIILTFANSIRFKIPGDKGKHENVFAGCGALKYERCHWKPNKWLNVYIHFQEKSSLRKTSMWFKVSLQITKHFCL